MKHYIDKNVYESACERFDYIYTHFERVCVSFSNGKDSGVLHGSTVQARHRIHASDVQPSGGDRMVGLPAHPPAQRCKPDTAVLDTMGTGEA